VALGVLRRRLGSTGGQPKLRRNASPPTHQTLPRLVFHLSCGRPNSHIVGFKKSLAYTSLKRCLSNAAVRMGMLKDE